MGRMSWRSSRVMEISVLEMLIPALYFFCLSIFHFSFPFSFS